jgi:hypothetical protein
MRLPIVLRSWHDAELAAAKAETDRLRGERNKAVRERGSFNAAAGTAARQFEDADRSHKAAVAENVRLAGQVKALSAESKTADLLAEHDAHRKTLAAALGAEPESGWEALVAEAGKLRRSVGLQTVIDATKARHTRPVDDDHRPIDGAPMAPRSLASELLRQKGRADVLAAELAVVTAANQACTCGGEPE